MNLSNFAAKFYEENLRYPDGTTGQCVIADTCIGGVKVAADFAAKFEKEKVDLRLSGTPSWFYSYI